MYLPRSDFLGKYRQIPRFLLVARNVFLPFQIRRAYRQVTQSFRDEFAEKMHRRKYVHTKTCTDEKMHERKKKTDEKSIDEKMSKRKYLKNAHTKKCMDEKMHERKYVQTENCETKKVRRKSADEKLSDEKMSDENFSVTADKNLGFSQDFRLTNFRLSVLRQNK